MNSLGIYRHIFEYLVRSSLFFPLQTSFLDVPGSIVVAVTSSSVRSSSVGESVENDDEGEEDEKAKDEDEESKDEDGESDSRGEEDERSILKVQGSESDVLLLGQR